PGASEALLAEFGGAGERGGTGADASGLAAFGGGGFDRKRCAIVEEIGHGMTLQAADLDGLLVVAVIDAGAFTKHIDRADARAAGAEDVGIEDGKCRAAEIALGDFLDEARNVNVSGAGCGARGIEQV